MIKRSLILSSTIAGLTLASCSHEDGPVAKNEVQLQVSVPGWDNASSRATEEMSPIHILLVPQGGDNIAKAITASENQFSFSMPDEADGTYDVYAVCGLGADKLPEKLSTSIDVPPGTDFASGSATVTVQDGVCTPSSVSITASRQMAWLELEISGVPGNVKSLNVYAEGQYEHFRLKGGWEITEAGESRFTQIPLTKDADGTYRCSRIMAPNSETSSVTFMIETATTGGTTTLWSYTSGHPLKAGTHLKLALQYGELLLDGGISLGGWSDKTDSGTLSTAFSFDLGQQYFSQGATVVNVSSTGSSINILAHKPMTVTLDEVRSWDKKNIPYSLSPEINVQRWALPTSTTSPQNVTYTIGQIGWDAFDAQFTTSGNEPIDRTLQNVIAYYDSAGDQFHVYNFVSQTLVPVTDETGEFLLYPLGIITLPQ